RPWCCRCPAMPSRLQRLPDRKTCLTAAHARSPGNASRPTRRRSLHGQRLHRRGRREHWANLLRLRPEFESRQHGNRSTSCCGGGEMTTTTIKQVTLDDVRLQIIKTRTRLNLSQADFAELIGADQSKLSSWETGSSAPSL